MYLLDKDKLEAGDIILTRSSSRISEMVRKWTDSQFSHAILYVGISSIIDSDGLGVQSNNIQRLLIEEYGDAVVLRIKDTNKKPLISKAEFFARQKIGTGYSTDEAKIAKVSKELDAKQPNRQFCTRFIAQAYESAGIKLVENAAYCVPEELLNSAELEIIDGVIRQASEKEIALAKSDSPLNVQRDIHNEILNKARELSGEDIQTFEQISEMLLKIPQIDQELTKFIAQSGYLTMMDDDAAKNPWHYNAAKMIEKFHHPEAIFNCANTLASNEVIIRERYEITLQSLLEINELYPREYFKMEIELYKKLLAFSHQRETEALKVLKYLNSTK